MAPKGRDTRPTPDRVREALFASLGPRLPGAVVVDLYAGTGALAIEALSRGAASAVLVESDRHAVGAVRTNLEVGGVTDRARIVAGDVAAFCAAPSGGPFDLVLCDPPYAVPLATCLDHLEVLEARGALADDVHIVIERDRRDADLDTDPPGWLAVADRRSYGDVALVRLERAPDAQEPP